MDNRSAVVHKCDVLAREMSIVTFANYEFLVQQVGLVSPTEGKGNRNSSPPKTQTPEENKRPDTLLARFERRDLKKANTLPSSVTGTY